MSAYDWSAMEGGEESIKGSLISAQAYMKGSLYAGQTWWASRASPIIIWGERALTLDPAREATLALIITESPSRLYTRRVERLWLYPRSRDNYRLI